MTTNDDWVHRALEEERKKMEAYFPAIQNRTNLDWLKNRLVSTQAIRNVGKQLLKPYHESPLSIVNGFIIQSNRDIEKVRKLIKPPFQEFEALLYTSQEEIDQMTDLTAKLPAFPSFHDFMMWYCNSYTIRHEINDEHPR